MSKLVFSPINEEKKCTTALAKEIYKLLRAESPEFFLSSFQELAEKMVVMFKP